MNNDGISLTKLDEDFNARILSKAINSQNPLIIALHGSAGGYLPDRILRPLVQKGFDVVNLSYFGSKGLSEKLELIPLEYLYNVVESMRQSYPGRKMVLLGVSRGAELGLLYGSYFNNIDAIIAYSPSCIVLPESLYNSDPSTYQSSWSYKGNPIPFAPIQPLPAKEGEIIFKDYFPPLLEDKTAMEKYAIPVENIKCPVQLISGDEDQIWPSSAMGAWVERRMNISPNALVFHDSYPNVGHQFLFFGDDPTKETSGSKSIRIQGKKYSFPFGGTDESTWAGMILSRDRTLYFLNKIKL